MGVNREWKETHQRQEDDGDHILELLGKVDGKTPFPRNNETGQKGTCTAR